MGLKLQLIRTRDVWELLESTFNRIDRLIEISQQKVHDPQGIIELIQRTRSNFVRV